jgi:hypothetical protein
MVIILSVVILGNLASANPDGFEWAFFEIGEITEVEGGFGGVFAFLGDSALAELVSGVVGIVIVLVIGYGFFYFSSRRE